jgi:hypothetical protein
MRYAVLLVLAVFYGCGASKPPDKEVIPLSDLSPEIIDVAKKTLPDVKFESARKLRVDNEDVYEIRGKMSTGKIREVEVSASGKVIEVE